MFSGGRDQETICAVSTPSGYGGISVIRVSGSKALKLVRSLCDFLPAEIQSHKCYHGILSSKGDPIDEVLVTYFVEGRSYTGEETLEISCHGSTHIVANIIRELVRLGARSADRGEFTYRAFMNGKMDLVQAESVLALIESQGKQVARQALHQLQGELSEQLVGLETELVWCLAHLEADIDFSQEGLQVISHKDLGKRLTDLFTQLESLVGSYREGRILKEGFLVSLIGVPNVGKSSLFNRILAEERAIVTEVPGTTRDLIEESITVDGVRVRFVDTAGLRETSDQVERLGVAKSRSTLRRADLIFYVVDASQPDFGLLDELPKANSWIVFNKMDLVKTRPAGPVGWPLERCLYVSALDSHSKEMLLKAIRSSLGDHRFEDQAILLQSRHFELLSLATSRVQAAITLLHDNASPEFIALELKDALLRIQETLGKRFDDQILDRVFKEFCIGK